MKPSKLFYAIGASLLALSTSTTLANDYHSRAERDYDRQIIDINKDIVRNHAKEDALHVISVETGVPPGKLDEIVHDRPKANIVGVMVACTIADYTKRDPVYYVDLHYHHNESWARLIADSHVPFERVDKHLSRLENYVHQGPEHRPAEIRR